MNRRLIAFVCLMVAIATLSGDAQSIKYPDPTQRVLTHREQNELVTPWIKKRFDTLLGAIMTREGIDMWIIPTREYNEDPVFASMSPLTYFSSRRRSTKFSCPFNPSHRFRNHARQARPKSTCVFRRRPCAIRASWAWTWRPTGS